MRCGAIPATGSRHNIAAHYDLGNALFSLFLDSEHDVFVGDLRPTDDSPRAGIAAQAAAASAKNWSSTAGDHLLEIGTGWGGMAMHAAKHYGCRVTTTTISQEQHASGQSSGSQRRACPTASPCCFRTTATSTDSYDKLVSIEMIEAIGHQYLDTYFAKCASLLKPGGLALIQAITIEDHRYEQALHSVDFIKRHIFPGSFIPCVSAMVGLGRKAGELRLLDLEDIGASYAQTLHDWRKRFYQRHDQVRALGYDERFVRMWEFYLAYCEGGFLERVDQRRASAVRQRSVTRIVMASRLPQWALTAFNILGFQAVWLLCVYGAGNGRWLPGIFAAAVFAALTLWFSHDRNRDLRTLAIALPIGFAMDSLLAQSVAPELRQPVSMGGLGTGLDHGAVARIRADAQPFVAIGLPQGPADIPVRSYRRAIGLRHRIDAVRRHVG